MPACVVGLGGGEDAFAVFEVVEEWLVVGKRVREEGADGFEAVRGAEVFEGGRVDVAEVDAFALKEFADVGGFGGVEFGEWFDAEGTGGDVEGLHIFGKTFAVHGGVEVFDGAFKND